MSQCFFYSSVQSDGFHAKQLRVTSIIKLHYFTRLTQSKECKTQIQTLDSEESVIQVDYSDNYKNKQNEIKSAFYS